MLYDLEINNSTVKVAIADSPETRSKGLSGLERLGKNKGMLFIFPEEQEVSMVMDGMNFPLDFIFLDKNWNVIDVNSSEGEPIYSKLPIYLVLELNKGSIERFNIKINDKFFPSDKLKTHCLGVKKYKHGGTFELVGDKVYEVKVDDIKVDDKKLQLLNTKGEVVANIESGARIFSREDTKKIIADYKKKDKDALTDHIIFTIEKQDKQKQDYVTK